MHVRYPCHYFRVITNWQTHGVVDGDGYVSATVTIPLRWGREWSVIIKVWRASACFLSRDEPYLVLVDNLSLRFLAFTMITVFFFCDCYNVGMFPLALWKIDEENNHLIVRTNILWLTYATITDNGILPSWRSSWSSIPTHYHCCNQYCFTTAWKLKNHTHHTKIKNRFGLVHSLQHVWCSSWLPCVLFGRSKGRH